MSDELVLTEREGMISVPAATLSQIVARAVGRVHGASVRRPRRNVDVDVAGSSATVSIRLVVRYGIVLPEVAEVVQREVVTALGEMCGLKASTVDVAIEELVES
jgi:uncharacterized alkaline shock family protein YloU